MCIIAVKPKGVKMIDDSIIDTMFYTNPDGAGYMYALDGRVHIKKGFMYLEDLYESLEELKEKCDITNIPLILHFRISTSGKVDGKTCHPFPVSSNLKDLRERNIDATLGMAHNGVIYDYEERKSIYSDTQLFVNKCVSYLYSMNPHFLNDPRTEAFFEPIINGSRLAFLDGDGNIYRYGEWIEDDGIYYSNSGYIESHYIHYNHYTYGYDYYDNYDKCEFDNYEWGDEQYETLLLDKIECYQEIIDSDDIYFIQCAYNLIETCKDVEFYDVKGMTVKLNPSAHLAIRIDEEGIV